METKESSLLSFGGRIGRSSFSAIAFGVPALVGMLLGILPISLLANHPLALLVALGGFVVGFCFYLYVLLAAIVKRLRDIGKEPYLVVIALLPLVNLVFYLYLSCVRAANDTSTTTVSSLVRGAAKATTVLVLMFVIQVAFTVIKMELIREFGRTESVSVIEQTAISSTHTAESFDQLDATETTYY